MDVGDVGDVDVIVRVNGRRKVKPRVKSDRKLSEGCAPGTRELSAGGDGLSRTSLLRHTASRYCRIGTVRYSISHVRYLLVVVR